MSATNGSTQLVPPSSVLENKLANHCDVANDDFSSTESNNVDIKTLKMPATKVLKGSPEIRCSPSPCIFDWEGKRVGKDTGKITNKINEINKFELKV